MAVGSTRSPVKLVGAVFFPGVKGPVFENDHSLPSGGDITKLILRIQCVMTSPKGPCTLSTSSDRKNLYVAAK
jgi:hypothetical protein